MILDAATHPSEPVYGELFVPSHLPQIRVLKGVKCFENILKLHLARSSCDSFNDILRVDLVPIVDNELAVMADKRSCSRLRLRLRRRFQRMSRARSR